MITADSQLYADIEALSAIDKLMLVDWILNSLNKPDPEIDELWSVEVKKRLDAYEKKQIKGIELKTILPKYIK